MSYTDITSQYTNEADYTIKMQQYYIDNEGVKYEVDGKYVILNPTQREIEVAKMLGEAFGGEISIIPKVNEPENIKTPDYIIDGERFDLKEIHGNSKNTLYDALRKQRRQADNFIFDITKTEINQAEAIKQLQYIYSSRHRRWVRILVIIENNKILKIYKRD